MTCHPEINGRIVAWLRQRRRGFRHGNGECWTLAEDALLASGAESSRQFTPHFSGSADYVWGDEERTLTSIVPGDVLQVSDYSVQKTVRVIDFISGPAGRARPQMVLQLLHHTAIVTRVIIPGALLEVVEQNVPLPGSTRPDRLVQDNRFALISCQGRESVLTDSGDEETTLTSYTVLGGRIRAFHPQPRQAHAGPRQAHAGLRPASGRSRAAAR